MRYAVSGGGEEERERREEELGYIDDEELKTGGERRCG